MQIDFYFDPLCPWCWITSRWITEVAAHRDLELTWQPFSLALKNDEDGSKDYRPVEEWGLRGLRVIEAVRKELGDEAVGRVYAEMGARRHNDSIDFPDHADILATLDIDPVLAAAADDDAWDVVIERSMDTALELAGDDVGVPTIVYGGRTAFFGPVISPAPTGDAALRLWDGLATLATTTEGFFELKRTREVGPIFGERPQP
jgi:2-hydroxychromene-2-carboxylate isomerase